MSSSRRGLVCAALIGGLIGSSRVAAQVESQAHTLLVGKWRHIALVRVIDGNTLAPQHFNGETIAEFKSDGTWSAIGPNSRSAGTYRWLDADQIEQTIVDSNLVIQLGQVSIKQIRVDSSRLNIVVTQRREDMERYMPPAAPGTKRPNEVTVITIFSRVLPE